MAILVDYNQVLIGAVAQSQKHLPDSNIDIIRHMFLNSLLSYNKKFSDTYGEIVLCCDSRNSWRRDIFPYYKHKRRTNKDSSPIDWNQVFECIDILREEIEEYFPYKVVKVERAEGDDIIAVLAMHFSETRKHQVGLIEEAEPLLIISSDKDFKQLQILQNIDQWSPLLKKFVRENRPDLFLKRHIIKGDSGDGIPNFLSDDNTFVIGKRQRPIRKQKLDEWIKFDDPKEFCDDVMLRNWHRNKKIIDLIHEIPDTLRDSILECYEKATVPERSVLLSYFVKNKLRNLMSEIQNF